MTAGQLSAFIFYTVMVATAGRRHLRGVRATQAAAGASERIRELLATPTEINAPATPLALPSPRGGVAFEQRDIQLPDPPAGRALKDFHFRSRPVKLSPWSARGAGKEHVFSGCCCAFSDRRRAWCRWTALTSKPLTSTQRERFALVSQSR